MDIVRRYNRPQSSTSELLSSLVELGLLYKDPYSRSYSLSPRAALIGSTGQAEMVRDGRLARLLDRLVAQTGLSVALFGMVSLNAQILCWRPGKRGADGSVARLYGGMQDPLSQTAAGWLLLSTLARPRRDGMIRRLNAEASADRKFAVAEMTARIEECADARQVRGPAGFGSRAEVLAMLAPAPPDNHPLAVGFVYDASEEVNADALPQCLEEGMRQVLGEQPASPALVERLPNPA
jgi:DNA-binding IclR family transcriptional regulator